MRSFALVAALTLGLGVPASAQVKITQGPEQITVDIDGKCPRCGMSLVRAAPYDVRDYRLDFTTVPAVVKPGQKATLRFKVFHPGTGEQIKKFEVVHEKQYHLFVIGQDMQHFEHIHPEQQPDGTWSIDVALPKAGYYKVISDFVPGGGAAHVHPRHPSGAGVAHAGIGGTADDANGGGHRRHRP